MNIVQKPEDIEYLALEGGGGKGVTYLGAIRALEELGILPIDITKPGSNQIKGISGSSAGAITALFLAMGLDSTELQKILSEPKTFLEFFDSPKPGVYRSIDKLNKPATKQDSPSNPTFKEWWPKAIPTKIKLADKIYPVTSIATAFALSAISKADKNIWKQIRKAPYAYLYNLNFDRGLFPGFAQREFFKQQINKYLLNRNLEPNIPYIQDWKDGSDLNFTAFKRLTGIELVMMGANITRHRPGMFSSRYTPQFPVAEAIGISMNLPFLFKPVYIEANVPVGKLNQSKDDYHGFWIDGGILNNFPLHAFDFLGPQVSTEYPNLRPLNKKMLGLRLTEGPDATTKTKGNFAKHFGDIFQTLMYPAEQGQIRTLEEQAQTIDLFTYDLKTTEFAPSKASSEVPIKRAYSAVYEHFGLKQP